MGVHRPKVLLVDHVSKVLGGAEVNVVELLSHPATRTSWDVTVAAPPDAPLARTLTKTDGPPIEPYHLGSDLNELRVVGRRFRPLAHLRGWRELRRATRRLEALVDRVRPDVVLSCTNKDHFAAGAAALPRRLPSIWWVNDLLVPEFFGWPVRRVFVQRARRLRARLAAVSGFGRDALVAQGVPRDQVVAIPNGIPIGRYRRDSARPLRATLGVADDEPVFGLVGRITPWKGHEVFLRTASAWHRTGRPGRFVIIGAAFNEDAGFAEGLHRTVEREGLADRVRFVPFQPDIAAALSSLDVLVHTSTRPEPFGRVLIEAMAVGVPVVAARGGGVPEIVRDDTNGALVEPGDVNGYVRALGVVTDDPVRRGRWIAEGLRIVRERFSIDRVFADFDRLVRGGGPSA